MHLIALRTVNVCRLHIVIHNKHGSIYLPLSIIECNTVHMNCLLSFIIRYNTIPVHSCILRILSTGGIHTP
jgi:hypothetical protein